MSESVDRRYFKAKFFNTIGPNPDIRRSPFCKDSPRPTGGAYDLDQVRTLMRGVSRQAVDKRVQDGSLLAVPGPSNRRSYPTLQFNCDGTVVPGLKAVREALRTTNPWAILNFLSHADARLSDRKPIELLKSGNLHLVLEAARRHGEQGDDRPAPSRRPPSAQAGVGAAPGRRNASPLLYRQVAPIFFDISTDGRFNAPDASYGVLYAARKVDGAFAETFLRTPGRTLIDTDLLQRKAYVRLTIDRDLKLIWLAGPGLARLGATRPKCHMAGCPMMCRKPGRGRCLGIP